MNSSRFVPLSLSLFLFCLLSPLLAGAAICPAIDKIPDYNCDGELRITVLGDSFVYGYGDQSNRNRGGYALRLERKLRRTTVTTLGFLGLRAQELLDRIDLIFTTDELASEREILTKSDIIILDIGRNDRWLFGLPKATFTILKEARERIRSEITTIEGSAPVIVTAIMMLPNRGSQGPWVAELNSLILKSNSRSFPSNLRFDLVSKRLLGGDQLHPTSLGYQALNQTALKYLQKTLPKIMKQSRPDRDRDGLPDILETTKFGTDPLNFDSDGDGKGDGAEVFETSTDPLVVD